jgi:hypothetical protein
VRRTVGERRIFSKVRVAPGCTVTLCGLGLGFFGLGRLAAWHEPQHRRPRITLGRRPALGQLHPRPARRRNPSCTAQASITFAARSTIAT